jgi:hypothetical protein
MLRLWDLYFLRGDRFFGFFLALSIFLRHKTEFLGLHGPALRKRLEELITVGATPVLRGGDADDAKGIRMWCEEADRLDRITPVSFRVNVGSLEVRR